MTATYLNFDLLIDRGAQAQRYRARVIQSPAGEDSGDFSLPFTPDELVDFLWRTAGDTRHLGAAPEESESALDARAFGSRLYQAALAGPVGNLLRRSLDEADRRGVGLRIRLRLDRAALDLAELPWEFLFAPDLDRFLVLSDLTPIVRYIELDRPVQPLAVRLPLTVLAVVANPSDVPPLAVEREWQNLQAALDPLVQRGVIALERLDAATLPALQARLRRGGSAPVNLLHFVGHGSFDAEANTGGLVFEDERGRAATVTAEALGMLLHDHAALRLIFLNACEAAQSGRRDPFAGVAQRLVQQGAPAVLAMQFRVTDAAAIALSQTFYQALADGLPADTALSQARKAIAAAGNPWEWATPVLFSRAEDNRLFDLQEAAQDPLFGLPSPPAFALPDKPFHYLEWYRREDAEIFFGRGREIRDLYDRVTAEDGEPIILLYGQSGVGKSSLLAAGLLPRLEGSHLIRYVRREQGLGLLGTLAAALDGVSEQDLATAWHEMEAQSGKPLLAVLDQVEEVFTRPNMQQPDELANFLDALAQLFGDGANRPRGRLILGFRKEWLAEVNKRLEERRLTRRRSEVFLERLGRAGIGEVVAGPQSTPRLRARYGLTVAEELPQLIADDLLADRGSPVAPMLAILLADMWDAAKARSYDRPVFDEELYHEFRTRGLSLNDFLGRQLGALRNEMPEVVDSGLALDVLAYHTTPLGTAEQRTLADLEHTYSHRLDVLPRLVQQCQDLYLLVDPARNQPGQSPASRLTHDTLAPHVRKRFDESVAPGQRARRILESRGMDWGDGRQGATLDEADLAAVEAGREGARAWNPDEERLVRASQAARDRRREEQARIKKERVEAERREQEKDRQLAHEQRLRAEEAEMAAARLRKRLIMVTMAVAVAAIALVVAVVFGADNRTQRDRAENALATAMVAQGQAEFQAENARAAQATAEAERAEAQKQASIARIGELAAESQAVTADAPQLGLLLAAQAVKDSLALGEADRVVKAEQALTDALSRAGGMPLAVPGNQIYGLVFSEDGRWLVAQSTWDTPTRIWDMNADGAGKPRPRRIGVAALSLRDHAGIGSDTPPDSFNSSALSRPSAEPGELSMDSPPTPPGIDIPVPPSIDPTVPLRQGPTISVDSSVQLTRPGDPIGPGHQAEFSPNGLFAAVYHVGDGKVRLWNIGNDLAKPSSALLDGIASTGTFSPDSCQLATGDTSGVIRVWDLCGSYPPVAPLTWAGHAITVTAVAYSADGRLLATAAKSDDVKLWNMSEGQPAENPGVLDNDVDVDQLQFGADDRWLLTSPDRDVLRVWRIANLVGEIDSTLVKPVLQQDTNRFDLSRDGRWLVSVQNSRATSTSPSRFDVTFFQLETEGQQPELVNKCSFSGDAERVTISQDGRWVAVTRESGDIMLLDAESADPCTAPLAVKAPSGQGGVTALFSPDSRWLAAWTGFQQIAHLWQLPLVAGQAKPVVLHGHDAAISAAALSTDSRWLATGGIDGEVRLWDLASATIGAALPVTFEKGYEFCFEGCKTMVTPDSKWIAVSDQRGDNSNIAFWEIGPNARAEPAFLCSHPDIWGFLEILDMVYNAEARLLVVLTNDNGVDLFDVDFSNQTCAHKMALEQDDWPGPDSTPVGVSHDGRWLILQHVESQETKLWDMTGGANTETVPCNTTSPPTGAALAGQVLLGGHMIGWGSDESGATWCRDRLLASTDQSVASPNQLWGAIYDSNDADSGAKIWNLDFAAPQVIRTLSGLGGSGKVLAIDNSGRWFAQHDGDGFSLYQLNPDGAEMPPVLTLPDSTSDAAFSEDGRWFAAVSDGGTIRLWKITELGRLSPLLFQLDPDGTQEGKWIGASVAFTPDSQWLIAFSTTVVKLWPLAAQTWIDQACQVAARPMTPSEMWLHLGDMSDLQTCLE